MESPLIHLRIGKIIHFYLDVCYTTAEACSTETSVSVPEKTKCFLTNNVRMVVQ